MEDDKFGGEIIPEFDQDTGELRDQRGQDRLQYILSSLQRGWRIVVMRESPSWCRGHLETIEFYGDEDEPIDVDYLARTWGGKRLHVKVHNEKGQWVGGGSVSLFSYPPKVHGKVITEQQTYEENFGLKTQSMPSINGQQQSGFQLDIGKILDLVTRNKGGTDQIGNILKVLDYAQQRQQPQAPPIMQQQNMFEQMAGMMSAMKQFREVMSDFGAVGGQSSGDDEFSPMIGQLMQALINRQPPQGSPPRGAIAPPRGALPRPPAQPQMAPPPQPKKQNENIDLSGVTETQLAKRLSDLDPENAVGAVFLALDMMPEEKRQAAMKEFFSAYTGSDQLDDDDLQEDTVDQNEE